MAGQKVITNSSGVLTEVASVQTSAGAGDAGKLVALNSSGILDSTQVNSKTTSAGAGDSGKIPALNASGILDPTIVNSKTSSAGSGDSGKLPALDGTGKLDSTFMPTGVGADTITATASEALSSGNFVNIYNNAGTPNCRKADATSAGKEANGFVLASVSSSATATIYLRGQNTGQTGLTAGPAFLSSTAGNATGTAPSTSGNVVQRIGVIINSTTVDFTPGPPITLA